MGGVELTETISKDASQCVAVKMWPAYGVLLRLQTLTSYAARVFVPSPSEWSQEARQSPGTQPDEMDHQMRSRSF
jgi:hypothetical protein